MANIKSAKKRVLIAEANRQKNVAFKTSIKTAVKKQDSYGVNDIVTVKADRFLEEHTLTGEAL